MYELAEKNYLTIFNVAFTSASKYGIGTNLIFGKNPNIKNFLVQLNVHQTDPYFLQNFQSNMTVYLIIHEFCKVCLT